MQEKTKPKLLVAPCSHKAAKYAVMNWHYSKCMPVGKLVKYGVWEDGDFIGVVIFGRGATHHLGTRYGLSNTQNCELCRIALKTHKTTVSKIVKISLLLLRKNSPYLRLVVSFADTGENHVGAIYQAGNWLYTGDTGRQKFALVNGKIVHPRTVSIWVKSGKVKQRSDIKHIKTAAKHRYLYPLDKTMRKQIELLRQPYPKCPVGEKVSRPSIQPEVGGAIPTTGLKVK